MEISPNIKHSHAETLISVNPDNLLHNCSTYTSLIDIKSTMKSERKKTQLINDSQNEKITSLISSLHKEHKKPKNVPEEEEYLSPLTKYNVTLSKLKCTCTTKLL